MHPEVVHEGVILPEYHPFLTSSILLAGLEHATIRLFGQVDRRDGQVLTYPSGGLMSCRDGTGQPVDGVPVPAGLTGSTGYLF
jgi:hypothetical protein